jgi:glycosyltransferase involved in cell wall biosynthesis
MRVLHIITSGQRRGGDVFAADLAHALEGGGVKQRIAALRAPVGASVSFPAPVDVVASERRSVPGLNIDPGAVRSLRDLIGEWRPEIVQAHGGETYKYALAANPTRRPRVIYRRIGGAPKWVTHGPRRFVHAQLMRRADRIVAVAETVRRETIDLFGVDPSRISTIPNGVSRSRIMSVRGRDATRRELGIRDDAVVTLSIGALSWEKDPLAQLEAATRVLLNFSGSVHVFVGEGPMRGQLEGEIRQRGLWGRCRVLGERSDVGDLYAASDVFLFASRPDGMEGMPATVIEAGMAGVPVAGYSIAGVSEVVEHGHTGLLAPCRDLNALTRQLMELVGDKGRRRAMGESARAHCRRFDIEAIAPRYLALYSDVLASS